MPIPLDTADLALDVRLLGTVEFAAAQTLQQQLAEEAANALEPRLSVLICEHPAIITLGRNGSRADVRLSQHELTARQIELRHVARGGGAVLHAPGQIAIYPIEPIAHLGWTAGDFLRRLQAALFEVANAVGVRAEVPAGRFGLWGRTGQLAAVGVNIRRGVTLQGAWLNVNPSMNPFGYIDTDPAAAESGGKTTMSCLLAERGQPVKITAVRTALPEQLASAFGCARFHVHSGHPLLTKRL